MAEVTIDKRIGDLKKLFNRVNDVLYSEEEITDPSAALPASYIPVGEDGVNFDAGDPDITKYKLTDGQIWTAIADAGDADISFQVPSVADYIADLFQNKTSAKAASMTLEGKTYTGNGYDFSPKKVTGSMILRSQDKKTVIILTNIEGYATPKLDDTGKPLYFNFSVSPLNNSEGVAIYYMFEDGAATEP